MRKKLKVPETLVVMGPADYSQEHNSRRRWPFAVIKHDSTKYTIGCSEPRTLQEWSELHVTRENLLPLLGETGFNTEGLVCGIIAARVMAKRALGLLPAKKAK